MATRSRSAHIGEGKNALVVPIIACGCGPGGSLEVPIPHSQSRRKRCREGVHRAGRVTSDGTTASFSQHPDERRPQRPVATARELADLALERSREHIERSALAEPRTSAHLAHHPDQHRLRGRRRWPSGLRSRTARRCDPPSSPMTGGRPANRKIGLVARLCPIRGRPPAASRRAPRSVRSSSQEIRGQLQSYKIEAQPQSLDEACHLAYEIRELIGQQAFCHRRATQSH